LTAPTRRHDAAAPAADRRAHGLWQDTIKIRREWLDHGLSTRPADRPTAEHALTAIYARIARPQPRFAWVDSPVQAIPLVTGLPTLGELCAQIRDPHPRGAPGPGTPNGAAMAILSTCNLHDTHLADLGSRWRPWRTERFPGGQ
jgi:hypothetical protein